MYNIRVSVGVGVHTIDRKKEEGVCLERAE